MHPDKNDLERACHATDPHGGRFYEIFIYWPDRGTVTSERFETIEDALRYFTWEGSEYNMYCLSLAEEGERWPEPVFAVYHHDDSIGQTVMVRLQDVTRRPMCRNYSHAGHVPRKMWDADANLVCPICSGEQSLDDFIAEENQRNEARDRLAERKAEEVRKRLEKTPAPTLRLRVQKMAEEGEISGQVAYYLLNGQWPEQAVDA